MGEGCGGGKGAPCASGSQLACFCTPHFPQNVWSSVLLEPLNRGLDHFSHSTRAGLQSARPSGSPRGPVRIRDPLSTLAAHANSLPVFCLTRPELEHRKIPVLPALRWMPHGPITIGGGRARGMMRLVVGAPAGLRHSQCPGRRRTRRLHWKGLPRDLANHKLGRVGPWHNGPCSPASGTIAPTVPRTAGSALRLRGGPGAVGLGGGYADGNPD